jgi:hypothetical protein
MLSSLAPSSWETRAKLQALRCPQLLPRLVYYKKQNKLKVNKDKNFQCGFFAAIKYLRKGFDFFSSVYIVSCAYIRRRFRSFSIDSAYGDLHFLLEISLRIESTLCLTVKFLCEIRNTWALSPLMESTGNGISTSLMLNLCKMAFPLCWIYAKWRSPYALIYGVPLMLKSMRNGVPLMLYSMAFPLCSNHAKWHSPYALLYGVPLML